MTLMSYLVSLTLTIIIESLIAKLVLKKYFRLLTFILINLITHPLLSFSLLIIFLYSVVQSLLFPLILLEITVVFFEGVLLNMVYKERGTLSNLKLSFIINLCSFLPGLLVI